MDNISNEQLIEHAQENIKALRFALKQNAFRSARPAIARDLKIAEIALEALRAKPVGWTDAQELREVENGGCGYIFNANPISPHADHRRVIELYTVPRAGLSVGSEPEWQINAAKLADVYGSCYVVFRAGEEPRCIDPTKISLSVIDNNKH